MVSCGASRRTSALRLPEASEDPESALRVLGWTSPCLRRHTSSTNPDCRTFCGSGSVVGRVLVGTDRKPWISRRRRCGWPAALAARPCSPSAGAVTAATSIAGRGARPRLARRAYGALAAAIAGAPKAGSITAITSAPAASAGASRRFAWGITLPRLPAHRSGCSRPGLRPATRRPRDRWPQIPTLRRLDCMLSPPPCPQARLPACSAARAAMPRPPTSPALESNRVHARARREAHVS